MKKIISETTPFHNVISITHPKRTILNWELIEKLILFLKNQSYISSIIETKDPENKHQMVKDKNPFPISSKKTQKER